MRANLPTGTVTFLFTDVEGSTKLLHELGAETYADALAEHRRVVRAACAAEEGVEVDTQGDAFFFAFSSARGAAGAAQAITDGVAPGLISLRIGLHTGTPLVTGEGYVGDDVHLAARVAAAGHGGQVLLSKASRSLVDGLATTDLGEHRLKDVEEAVSIYQLGSQRFPPLKTISNTNLPRPASSFVGRHREREELVSMLSDGTRLLTLSGPGGSGKTRLALEVASELISVFNAGVFWIGLAALRDPAVVGETIAQTLGAKEELAEHVGERELLLLLDNFEQVVDAAPELSRLLETCPNLRLLVTSRELLRIRGEVEYLVSPLAEPEAVELFCQRARLEPNETIEELCRRLDDMPLALELAAARTRALTPSQILDRLAQRLDLLTGSRDADPRQQTLRATIEWSYDLLDEAEKELFSRLAIFAGGCTLDTAEEVIDADVATLASLVDKSVVRHTEGRYWLLETIREYADEKLEESPDTEALRDRHAAYYLALAKTSDSELNGPGQAGALEWFAVERENLRAAFERLLDRDPPAALRLVQALSRSWADHGYFQEARETLAAALERTRPEPNETRALCLCHAGWFAEMQGETSEGFRLVHESLDCARSAESTLAEIRALNNLAGYGYLEHHSAEEAIRIGEEAIALARAYGDRVWLAEAIGTHGGVMNHLGETEKANELWEEAYRLGQEIGNDTGTASMLTNLAWNALRAGDTVAARAKLEEALKLHRRSDRLHHISGSIINMGWVDLLEGNLDPARACFEEGAAIARQLGMPLNGAEALWGFAHVAAAAGDPDRAARLAGAAAAVGSRAGFDPATEITFAHHLDNARAALHEAAWRNAWDDGAALDLEAALELVLAQ